MATIENLHRLNAEATQKIIAKRLCNLMDDEWKLGRGLYMEVAKEILVSIEFPELLAKAEAHEALVAENERIKKHAESALKAAVEVKSLLSAALAKLGGRDVD